MPNRNLIGEAWLTYLDNVVPKDAGQTQIQECKRAFYAGAVTAYGICVTLPEDDDASLQLLNEVNAEMQAYSAAIGVSE
jgi:hypothetical protein